MAPFRILVLCLVASPASALAAEFVGLPALQRGPYGEGVIFADVENVDYEIALTKTEANGRETFGADRRMGRAVDQEAAVAASFGFNPAFRFSTFVSTASRVYRDETRAEPRREREWTSAATELGAGPVVGFGPLRLSGMASFVMLGEETSETSDAAGSATRELGSVSLPRLRLYGGWIGEHVTVGARARLYNDAFAPVDADADADEGDAKRRLPGEFGLDARWRVSKELDLGTGMALEGLAQARGSSARDAGRVGVGGVYRPVPWFGVAGGLRYAEASYRDDRDASLLVDNLGGTRLDLGACYDGLMSAFQASLGYVVPDSVAYDTPYGVEPGWKFQGGETRIERSVWQLTFAGRFRW